MKATLLLCLPLVACATVRSPQGPQGDADAACDVNAASAVARGHLLAGRLDDGATAGVLLDHALGEACLDPAARAAFMARWDLEAPLPPVACGAALDEAVAVAMDRLLLATATRRPAAAARLEAAIDAMVALRQLVVEHRLCEPPGGAP